MIITIMVFLLGNLIFVYKIISPLSLTYSPIKIEYKVSQSIKNLSDYDRCTSVIYLYYLKL